MFEESDWKWDIDTIYEGYIQKTSTRTFRLFDDDC